MKEYRDVRAKIGFLDLCKRADLAAELTVTAADRIGADAAILFADILLIIEPMGFHLEFPEGSGPVISNPFRSVADLDRIRDPNPGQELPFVFDAIRIARANLEPHTPLIGFAGAPFTVASYLIEGGVSKHFEKTKTLMRSDPATWHQLLDRIARSLASYLSAQVAAGVQAVQLFDSWIGTLGPHDYRTYVLPHVKRTLSAIASEIPVIHFGTGTSTFLEDFKEAGGSVIGVDHREPLDRAWRRLGDVAIQGNLDPTVLLSAPDVIEREARTVLDQAGGRPGHIFNLGHGVLPSTPVDHVRRLIDFVHEASHR